MLCATHVSVCTKRRAAIGCERGGGGRKAGKEGAALLVGWGRVAALAVGRFCR